MKILLSWLEEYIDLSNLNINDISDTLTHIGLEVEDIKQIGCDEEYFNNLVVGEIIECKKHPNADRLYCTKVDVGSGIKLNIVCGAPNVKVGLKVVIAKVGATLISYSGEKFRIKKSKIRGEISEGMLCAEDEIGISNNHECIIELDEKCTVGQGCYEIYKERFIKKMDCLISVNLTPNLAYSSSYLGIAKDLGAALNVKTNTKYTKQDVKELDKNILDVDITDNSLCNRFSCILIRNVDIKESPKFIKDRLINSDIKPINNVVDLSNYVMLELGIPLHVYDFKKIGKNIKIETANGEEFSALNKKTYILKDDIIVSDSKDILALGGVIGGLSSSVDDNTTDILIECASYNKTYIRKTSTRLNLKTEASYRAERGIDENNIPNALNKYLEHLITQEPDIEICGYTDIINCNLSKRRINTSFTNINKIIGQSLDKNIIKDILNRLEIVTEIDNDNITAIIPSYRKNIEYENDIIHEILRFYGYDNLCYNEYYEHKILTKDYASRIIDVKNTFSDILCSNGFYEIRTNPLISKENVINKDNIIELKNPSSNYLNVLRNNLIYNGLEVIKYNINHSNKTLNLFEFGKTYEKNDADFTEQEHLAVYISGHDTKDANIYTNNPFFELKKYVFKLLHSYKLIDLTLNELQQDVSKLISGKTIFYKNEMIGYLGNVSDNLLNIYGITQDVFFADLYFYKILELISNYPPITYKDVSKYQIIRRDLSLILDENIKYEDVEKTIIQSDKKINSVNLIDIYINENNPQKKTYSISFYIDPGNENIDNNEILMLFNKVIDNCEKHLGAIIRKE